jgi:hypothetical protein
MSNLSLNTLHPSAKLTQVQDIVCLLGFKKVSGGLETLGLNPVAMYIWFEETDYRSWSGVELKICKNEKKHVVVITQSKKSRSYWDLMHQIRTVKLLKGLFGGNFQTDAGKNRYWPPDEAPPTALSSGCYLAHMRFKNDLQRAHRYIKHRLMVGGIANDSPSGFSEIDEINPRLLSNNMVVPYVLAVWEEYFRATFTACLRYSKQREIALKRVKLSHSDLEKLVVGTLQVERSIAEAFSFQRPSAISETFKLIDSKLDIAGALRKPYRGRKKNLFDSLEKLVENRNLLVHTGEINITLFDRQLGTVLEDLMEAVNRAYNQIAKHNGFVAID